MFTWQYVLFDPLAAIMAAFTLLMSGRPASPAGELVASCVHVTGPADWPLSFAGAGDAVNATPSTTAASQSPARTPIAFRAARGGRCAAAAAPVRPAGFTAATVKGTPRRIVIIVPPLGG